ncbi:unnamed protein product [Photorhabdus laumondii subsp. laumondii TTO1]|uniref:Photorhabdus luminescens subsp. laumondii TTO1 complete genome segment 8/17 n=1 Tax=Photorhabdus laumondii subsp. laumondii (strain DSM 15139 / CIP 105565 / TT01) TaxID=243265 RepID=Q7N4R7_PHOLL|nr:unnamed protein product [Photorhabdus laumondii subsp. laumondii TTO1]
MIWVSAQEVIAFHDRILRRFPGVAGIAFLLPNMLLPSSPTFLDEHTGIFLRLMFGYV